MRAMDAAPRDDECLDRPPRSTSAVRLTRTPPRAISCGSPIASKHVARGDLAGRAGRAGGNGDPFEIEGDHQRLRGKARHREERRVRQPIGPISDDPRLRRHGEDSRLHRVAQGRDPAHIRKMVAGKARRNGKPDNRSHIFGAGAPAPLLPAALQKRLRARRLRRQGPARRRPAGRRSCGRRAPGNRRRAPRCRPGMRPSACTASQKT